MLGSVREEGCRQIQPNRTVRHEDDMSDQLLVLEAVEHPCLSKDVGAPGSIMRRANDLGRELARLRQSDRNSFEAGYEQGVDEVLSEVKTADLDLYRRLCTLFNPARSA
jgi:hypothetical protein